MDKTVAILGASANKSRYANMAQLELIEKGFNVVAVNPNYDAVDGLTCYESLTSYPESVHTVTVYVQPSILKELTKDIISMRPKRVILNPGTESHEVIEQLQKENIDTQMACTLVLLNTNQF